MFFPVLYLLIFNFIPMYGVQIAFRDYRPLHGITGSVWVGLKWFKQFLSNYEFGAIFKNTVVLSLYSLAAFPLAIIFALVLHAIKKREIYESSTDCSVYSSLYFNQCYGWYYSDGSFRSFSYGAAVGLFNTSINLVLLLTVNYGVRKATDGEISLF